MKVTIIFFCILVQVIAEKRLLIDTLLDKNEINRLIDAVSEKFGTDATEKQCEDECHLILTNPLVGLGCGFACNGVENYLQKIHSHTKSVPQSQTTTAPQSPTTTAPIE